MGWKFVIIGEHNMAAFLDLSIVPRCKCPAFESTKCVTRAAGLSSEFSTYQVLSDLVDLFALRNTEVLYFTEFD